MNKIIAATLLLFLFACTNNAPTTSTTNLDSAGKSNTLHTTGDNTVVTGAQPVMLNGCYQMTSNKDTAYLQLTVQDTTVTGKLTYLFYQKDHNQGTISGILRNNNIYAAYTYSSEGTTSVREVAFQIQDTVLVEGFGPVYQKGKEVLFRDKAKLQFAKERPFVKVACQ